MTPRSLAMIVQPSFGRTVKVPFGHFAVASPTRDGVAGTEAAGGFGRDGAARQIVRPGNRGVDDVAPLAL